MNDLALVRSNGGASHATGEIEVTPEMIEAAAEVIRTYYLDLLAPDRETLFDDIASDALIAALRLAPRRVPSKC